jgi:hypothetical protein
VGRRESGRRLVVTVKRHEPPDLDRFVAALLALAIDRVEQEKAGRARSRSVGPDEGVDDAAP